jgi:hypothetical protein
MVQVERGHTNSRPVLLTEASTSSWSQGMSVRKSISSHEIPSCTPYKSMSGHNLTVDNNNNFIIEQQT